MLGLGFKKLISLTFEYVDCNSSSYVLFALWEFLFGFMWFLFFLIKAMILIDSIVIRKTHVRIIKKKKKKNSLWFL